MQSRGGDGQQTARKAQFLDDLKSTFVRCVGRTASSMHKRFFGGATGYGIIRNRSIRLIYSLKRASTIT